MPMDIQQLKTIYFMFILLCLLGPPLWASFKISKGPHHQDFGRMHSFNSLDKFPYFTAGVGSNVLRGVEEAIDKCFYSGLTDIQRFSCGSKRIFKAFWDFKYAMPFTSNMRDCMAHKEKCSNTQCPSTTFDSWQVKAKGLYRLVLLPFWPELAKLYWKFYRRARSTTCLIRKFYVHIRRRWIVGTNILHLSPMFSVPAVLLSPLFVFFYWAENTSEGGVGATIFPRPHYD